MEFLTFKILGWTMSKKRTIDSFSREKKDVVNDPQPHPIVGNVSDMEEIIRVEPENLVENLGEVNLDSLVRDDVHS